VLGELDPERYLSHVFPEDTYSDLAMKRIRFVIVDEEVERPGDVHHIH